MAPEVLSLHFRHKRGGALSRELVSENEIGTHPTRMILKSLMQLRAGSGQTSDRSFPILPSCYIGSKARERILRDLVETVT